MKPMDKYYAFPEDKIREIRAAKPWMQDAKYFKKVKVSPSATIKMLTHGQSGVEKGISQSGKPVEVMGLLLGRPDTEDLNSIIITDAMPMPCEGFETRVIVDDENVINYMIDMGESLEMTRHERFCGWYHTHPFDLDGTSHCYLSNTDVSTQLHWQRAEDKHGNHWVAIVLDPLLSLHQQKPEMMAFRVYPPEYTAPKDELPDGKIVRDDRQRVALWGACWNRYYRLDLEYFMSSLAQDTLELLRRQLLWPKGLTTPPTSSTSSLTRWATQVEETQGRYGRTKGRSAFSLSSSLLEEEPETAETSQPETDIADITRRERSSGLERDTRGIQKAVHRGQDLAAQHACQLCALLVQHNVFCSSATDSTAGPAVSASAGAITAAETSSHAPTATATATSLAPSSERKEREPRAWHDVVRLHHAFLTQQRQRQADFSSQPMET